jgi:Uma2 family endonuclease
MATPLTTRRFTVEYHRMAEAGILTDDDRIELLDGQIVPMTPIGRRHAGCVNRLTALFARFAGDAATVSVQNPLVLGEHQEPQPDLALLPYRADGDEKQLVALLAAIAQIVAGAVTTIYVIKHL